MGDTAYFTVPFAQRVTVGIQAFAKAFMVPSLFLIIIIYFYLYFIVIIHYSLFIN